VALRRILVVDDAVAVRETIGILLGGEYEVHPCTIEQWVARGAAELAPDLIVAARAAASQGPSRPFPAAIPLLWIDDPPSGGRSAASAGVSIPARFSPRELRQRVGELLSAPPAPPLAALRAPRLQPPYVSAEAASVLADAVSTVLPLHLLGESGTGKRGLARAVHAARGSGPFLPVSALHFDAAALSGLSRADAVLFVDRVDQLAPPAQQLLLATLEPNGLVHTPAGVSVRLITSATTDLEEAADAGAFVPDLFYRLTMLTVRLAPLRERTADIPALAQTLAAELAALFGRPPVSFTDRALERLSNYLWFGNVAELEAVLARSVALCRESSLDVDDLLFDGARPAGTRAVARDAADNRAALSGRPLDLIINELAHEFKNPLVTIKTFAHHLRRLQPGGDDEQVARLTGEAVEQIDQTLENLLEFTRLEAPVEQPVRLSAVLAPVVDECSRLLAARGIAFDHPPAPPVTIRGDPQQISYALGNLVHALTRDLGPTAQLALRYSDPAVLTFELPSGTDPLGSHLATLLDHAGDGRPPLPLGVAIANSVLERNGAHIVVSEKPRSTVTIHFSPADDSAVVTGTGNGTTTRTDRRRRA
jgi:signal transduction histidine kinase